jgi:hypothetical protein
VTPGLPTQTSARRARTRRPLPLSVVEPAGPSRTTGSSSGIGSALEAELSPIGRRSSAGSRAIGRATPSAYGALEPTTRGSRSNGGAICTTGARGSRRTGTRSDRARRDTVAIRIGSIATRDIRRRSGSPSQSTTAMPHTRALLRGASGIRRAISTSRLSDISSGSETGGDARARDAVS